MLPFLYRLHAYIITYIHLSSSFLCFLPIKTEKEFVERAQSSLPARHVRSTSLMLSASELREAAGRLNVTSIDYRDLGYITPVEDQACVCLGPLVGGICLHRPHVHFSSPLPGVVLYITLFLYLTFSK